MHINKIVLQKFSEKIASSIYNDASSLDNTLAKATADHDTQPLTTKGDAPKDMTHSIRLNKANYRMSHLTDKRLTHSKLRNK